MSNNLKVILGAAESGIGAALLAKSEGFKVFVSDSGKIADQYKEILQANGIVFEEGKHSEKVILMAEEVIKSPGIPEKAPIMHLLRKEGIRVISEIEFAARYTKAKLIAITGTNGKTTTTLLTYHLLKSAGLNVGLAGNIGDSFARQVIEDQYDYYVLEISSFQLDDCYEFRPWIGIMLNITPDHLDRYDNEMQNYIDSKFRLIQNMEEEDTLIYYADDKVIANELQLEQPPVQQKAISSKFFQEKKLVIPAKLVNPKAKAADQLVFDELPLKGMHNQINMSAAITAAMLAGASEEQVKAGLKTFKNAPHRLEPVMEINGIAFVNDSKATNVDSVFYALGSFESPIVWIAGGLDKGNDYDQIKDLVKNNVKALVCMGKDNKKILKYFKGKLTNIVETDNVRDAVKRAYEFAAPGDVVLLSPACASFDLFKNYEDRGEKFKEACVSLKSSVKN